MTHATPKIRAARAASPPRFPIHWILALTLAWMAAGPQAAMAEIPRAPEEDPPVLVRPAPEIEVKEAPPRKAGPEEWTYHKTSGGLHPDGVEQQQVWLMNRARQNPAAEGAWLSSIDDQDVVDAVDHFGVDLDVLQAEFNAYPAQPPAAFDVRLYNAAYAHSQYLISVDDQSHDGQRDRVDAAGFKWLRLGLSVFSYAQNGVHCHAGFNIDWGDNGDNGMQTGRGHRMSTMSLSPQLDGSFDPALYYNVGVAAVPEEDPETGVGPLVVTENFTQAWEGAEDHYNRFIVGTVWRDLNADGLYTPGEGVGGVTAAPQGGPFYAVTPDSGGYSAPLTESGWFDVVFTGVCLPFPVTRTVLVSGTSVLVDLKAGPDSDIDGVLDSFELEFFPSLAASDGSQDADDDGLNDADEHRWLTDPTNLDSDWDSMDDGWEIDYGLNPLADDGGLDPDEDGYTNAEEFAMGRNPTFAEPESPGDLDRNGKREMPDVLTIMRLEASGSTHPDAASYDMNGDGALNLAEVLLILRELSGLP